MPHHLCEYSGHISPSSAHHSTFSSSGFPPDSSEGTQQLIANLTKMLATFLPLSKPLNLFNSGGLVQVHLTNKWEGAFTFHLLSKGE